MHTRIHACVHTYTHTVIPDQLHVYLLLHIYIYRDAEIERDTSTYMHTRIRTCQTVFGNESFMNSTSGYESGHACKLARLLQLELGDCQKTCTALPFSPDPSRCRQPHHTCILQEPSNPLSSSRMPQSPLSWRVAHV